MVVWVTGLSGSGKTTFCKKLLEKEFPGRLNILNLDGDVIRSLYGKSLGYSVEHRISHFERVQKMCEVFTGQGLTVLVALLYSTPELLKKNRELFKDYYEVFIDADMNLLKERDQKQLYSSGEKNVVGLDIEYTKPMESDIVINVNLDHQIVDQEVNSVISRITSSYKEKIRTFSPENSLSLDRGNELS